MNRTAVIILIVILVLLCFAGPFTFSAPALYWPGGIVGVLLIVLLIMLLTGAL